MPASFERTSPEGIVGLPSEVIRGLVAAGVRELMRRDEPLPGCLAQPEVQQLIGQTNVATPPFISLADGRIQVFPNYGGVHIEGHTKPLEPKTYSALFCLAAKADELVTPAELIHACWPQSPPTTRNSLSQIVRRVRVALGIDDLGHPEGGAIQTIRQRGWVAITSLRNDPQTWF